MKRLLLFLFCQCLVSADSADKQTSQGISVVDALCTAIDNNPSLNNERSRVQADRSQIQREQAAFNPALKISYNDMLSRQRLDDADQLIYQGSRSDVFTQKGSLSVDQRFPSGLNVQPYVSVSSIDPLTALRQSMVQSYTDRDPTSQMDIGVDLSIPLLKGAGKYGAAANLAAAGINGCASELQYFYSISIVSQNVLCSYWNCRGAAEMVAIRADAVTAGRAMRADVQKLVDADQRPASDLDQLQASILELEAAWYQAEQNLREARIDLGNLLGATLQETADLSVAATLPPVFKDEIHFSDERIAQLITGALASRFDLAAARKKIEAADLLLAAARHNRLPSIAINGNANYSMLNEPRPRLYTEENEFSVSLGLSCGYPLFNDAATADVSLFTATRDQAETVKKETENRIRTRVWGAIKGLESASMQLQKESQSVEYYRKTAENERKKLSLGMATVLDIVSTEQHYRSALINELSARISLARAMAVLRFETGGLIVITDNKRAIPADNLLSLPE